MNWPRPPKDNGIGIHLGSANAQAELDKCLGMGMTWALVCNPDPETVIRIAKIFWQNGIMPVSRFDTKINEPFGWDYYTKKLADALGIPPYEVIYNEPGDDREWKNHEIPADWVTFFAHKWHRVANKVALAGGLPGLQVLSTRELRLVLEIGQAFYDGPFLNKGWFCPHNYGCKFPPEYYNEGEGKSIGVLSFLDFANVFREVLNRVPPFICGEGGWLNPGPPVKRWLLGDITEEQHAEWTAEMFGWFREGFIRWHEYRGNAGLERGMNLPDYLFAICPWILSDCKMQGWTDSWWLLPKTVQAVKEMSGFTRSATQIPPEEEDGSTGYDWRVVSKWITEDEAWNELADLERAGFHTYQLEERG